ncbi:DUF3368 domain-containing protein [Fibrisoma montanum]|uniref:DUF3368 domain-containing protein n=1 Tax=Fibrisoma montanum TaxID=2305895 RepID=A0A418MFK5_9BACT|nr:DUF3368 domain-containing protein [Fibrisoma montanum]RIV25584.1 DUF3368 domain-containing protein [Fibrisoma montanum]
MIVVSDTTIISNLYQVDLLPLLTSLYGEVIIPQAVADELHRLGPNLVHAFGWLTVRQVSTTEQLTQLLRELDIGESEALVLAQELQADWLLIDERKGRYYAELLHLAYIGTLGVLLEAKKAGLIPAVRPVLDELQHKAGAWYHTSLIREVLRQANESDS